MLEHGHYLDICPIINIYVVYMHVYSISVVNISQFKLLVILTISK